MKDFTGVTIAPGDRVVTFSNYKGMSAHFIEATVDRITNGKVYLKDVDPKGAVTKILQWTVPQKIVVLEKVF